MYNKETCRGCGNQLLPKVRCVYCNEYTNWSCLACKRIEDVTHVH